MKAIEHIVAGYVTLKDRVALEDLRSHRRKLLMRTRMLRSGPLNFDRVSDELEEEIGFVDAGIAKLDDTSSIEPAPI